MATVEHVSWTQRYKVGEPALLIRSAGGLIEGGFSNDASTLLTTANNMREVIEASEQSPVMRAAALLGATLAQIAAAFIERHDAGMVGREVEL